MIAKVFASLLAVVALTGTSFVTKTDCCSPSSGCGQAAKVCCLPTCCDACPDCCDAACCFPDCCDACPDCCDTCCGSGCCSPAKTPVKTDCCTAGVACCLSGDACCLAARDVRQGCCTEAGK